MSAASPISVAADFRIQQSDSKSSRHTTSSATTATTATTGHGHTHGHTHGLSNSNHTHGHDILNSSSSLIQVAVRIRPLMQFEHGNEACIQVFPNENELQTSLYKSTSNDSSMTWGATSTCTGTSKTGTASGNSGFGGFGDSDATGMQQPLTLSPSPSASSYQTLQIGKESDNHTYTFDHVFPSSTEQIEVYERCVTPLVESCLEGYNTTILAYGQTGSGKTHTILGNSSGTIDDVEGTLSNEGVIPRALKQIFNELDTVKEEAIRDAFVREEGEGLDHEEGHGHDHDHLNNNINININNNSPKAHSRNESPFEYQVKIQFLELYGEDIRDLLDTTSNSNSNHNNNANNTESSPSPLSSPSSPTRNTKQSPRNIRRPKRIVNRELSTASSMSTKSTRSTTTTKSQSTRSSASTLITIRDGRTGEDAEVLGIRNEKVTNANEALTLLTNGLSKRVVGKTAMNAHSSRSHAIFTVVVQQTRRKQSGIGSNAKTNVEMKTSKIHFVDLSGSERVKRSKTVGKSLKEGIDINKGLLVLGNVISALSSKKRGSKAHIPYRESKLTRLLKGSLGGNHKTLMIACVSPSSSNSVESINTLRYANRAKNIKNKAKINVDPASRVVNELKGQVVALAAELLKVRKQKEEQYEFDGGRDDDDCPFSIDFLDGLVSGRDSKTLWKQNARPTTPRLKPIPMRPKTEPILGPCFEDSVTTKDSWEVSERNIGTKHESMYELRETPTSPEEEEDSTSVEDPDIDKNILSYDFALTSLRQSLVDEAKESSTKQLDKRATLGLGKIRNIDELYDYLNQSESQDIEDETTIQDNISGQVDQVENVVSNHISKLDETISYNNTLLNEMTASHKRYEVLRKKYEKELQNIKIQVEIYEKDNNKIENVIDLIDEGSQYSGDMMECLRENEAKLELLEKKQAELKMLAQVTNQNHEEIQNLKKSIQVMKHQRVEMNQIANQETTNDPYTSPDVCPSNMNEKKSHSKPKRVSTTFLEGQTPLRQNHSDRSKMLENREDLSYYYREKSISDENKQISELKNEIAKLERKLAEKDKRVKKEKVIKEKQNNDGNTPLVPTTLNLISTGTDLSLLGISNDEQSQKRSNKNVLSGSTFNKIIKSHPTSSHKSRQSSKEQGFLHRVQTELENHKQFMEKWQSKPSDNGHTDHQPNIYDLAEKVQEPAGPPKQIKMRRIKKNSRRRQHECDDLCGGTALVRLIRNIFGRRGNPIVRQW